MDTVATLNKSAKVWNQIWHYLMIGLLIFSFRPIFHIKDATDVVISAILFGVLLGFERFYTTKIVKKMPVEICLTQNIIILKFHFPLKPIKYNFEKLRILEEKLIGQAILSFVIDERSKISIFTHQYDLTWEKLWPLMPYIKKT